SFDVLLPFGRGSPPASDGFGSVALSMPLGLIFGRPDPPLSRAISSRWAATVRRSSATSSSSFNTRSFRSACERRSTSGGGGIPRRNLTRAPLGIVKSYRHDFCPFYVVPPHAQPIRS